MAGAKTPAAPDEAFTSIDMNRIWTLCRGLASGAAFQTNLLRIYLLGEFQYTAPEGRGIASRSGCGRRGSTPAPSWNVPDSRWPCARLEAGRSGSAPSLNRHHLALDISNYGRAGRPAPHQPGSRTCAYPLPDQERGSTPGFRVRPLLDRRCCAQSFVPRQAHFHGHVETIENAHRPLRIG